MATSNSSIGGDDGFELTSPGQRTGEGAGSVLPYLHDSLATKPGELFPAEHPKPAKSLAGRMRKALLDIRKPKKNQRGPR
ncbi:MAG TPA: hypothetical protein VGA59_00575 [Ramlibacter sp.]|jgi:hypothetical protein